MAIKVVIVEDDKDLRTGLSQIISEGTDMTCIASFPSGEEFQDAFKHLNMDVVLMDIHLPGTSGIEMVARLKPLKPAVQYMMCTSFDDSKNIFESLKVGATGYLLKNTNMEIIQQSVREIMNGGSPMSPEIARLVVSSFSVKNNGNALLDSFSEKEQQILTLLSKGYQYKEMADKMLLSVETIRTYIRKIYERLEVHSRTEAVNKVFK